MTSDTGIERGERQAGNALYADHPIGAFRFRLYALTRLSSGTRLHERRESRPNDAMAIIRVSHGGEEKVKALRFDRFGEVEAVLHVEELPTPVPGPDEP